MTKSIFVKDKHIDPDYQYLEGYLNKMWRGFWTPAKYQKGITKVDAPYVVNRMEDIPASVVKRCVLAISIVEDKVKTFWSMLHGDIPQTVVGEVGGAFGNSEVVHSRSYRALAEALGIQEDFENIMKYPVIRGRVNYLSKYLKTDPFFRGKKRVLKKLILFTALVERASLFSQFYILMSFAQRNKGLKTISSLQASTAVEELLHYRFGVELINIIKKQHPQLWDDTMMRLIKKDLKSAYINELKLTNWIFEQGVPDHLTKEEVVNFISYNFNIIARDLEIPVKFEYDKKIYEEKNSWMASILATPGEPDFFDAPVGGYAATDEEESEGDLDDIFN
jgi:ribonucleoside-diphosphate reductase beta chain